MKPKQFKIMKQGFRGRAAQLAAEALPDSIPFSTLEQYEKRAWSNHRQTLERLNARGGLDPYELVALIEDRPLFGARARVMTGAEAVTRLSLWLSMIEDLEGDPERNAAAVERLTRELELEPVDPLKRKPDCYKCIHRGTIPGDAHSQCRHPEAREGLSSDLIAAMGEAFLGKAEKGRAALGIKGRVQTWPANYNPTFLEACRGFTRGNS